MEGLQNVNQIVRGNTSLVDKQFSVWFCYYLIKAESVYRNIYLPILNKIFTPVYEAVGFNVGNQIKDASLSKIR